MNKRINEPSSPFWPKLWAARRYLSFALALLVLLLAAFGVFGAERLNLALGFGGLALARLGWLTFLYVRRRPAPLSALELAETGVLGASLFLLGRLYSGGLASPLTLTLYFALGVYSAFVPLRTALLTGSVALLGSLALAAASGLGAANSAHLGADCLSVLAFSLLGAVVRRIDGRLNRQKSMAEVQSVLADIERDAKRLRLAQGALKPGDTHKDRETRQALSSYFEIREALQDILRMLALSQNAHTAAVLWFTDDTNERFKILEAFSSSGLLAKGDFSAQEGLLSGVVRSGGTPLRLTLSPGARKDLPYYRHPEAVGALLAVPIMNDEHLHGLIVIDRLEPEPFSDLELDVAQTAGTQAMRVMVNENHLRRLDKSQNEYFLLAEVSKALSQTLDRAGLLKVALEATRSIAPFDFAAIVVTRLGETTGEVIAAWPEDMGISGSYYESESNLIDWVVRNNTPLVYHDFKTLPRRPVIFCREEKLKNVASLLIVPLRVKGQVKGAFVLLSTEVDFFSEDLQHIFQIIANQMAVSMENAEIYAQVEQMAITDPLTGLFNKRYFAGRMDEILSRAERHDDTLAVVMLDIDHFKQVNDTYGHPLGDVVLKEVAKELKDSLRKIDLLARFGGEEFVLLLDATDADNAKRKAESLRERIAQLDFHAESGRHFNIHISLGMALFPEDGRQQDELIEKADVALYNSKKAGRNRVTMYRDL